MVCLQTPPALTLEAYTPMYMLRALHPGKDQGGLASMAHCDLLPARHAISTNHMKHLLALRETVPVGEPGRVWPATMPHVAAEAIHPPGAVWVHEPEAPEDGGHEDEVLPVHELGELRAVPHELIHAAPVHLIDGPRHLVALLDALPPEAEQLPLLSLVQLLEGNVCGQALRIPHRLCKLCKARICIPRPQIAVGVRLHKHDGSLGQDCGAPTQPADRHQRGAPSGLVHQLASNNSLVAGRAHALCHGRAALFCPAQGPTRKASHAAGA
mmetsp:Transcript_34388/g.95083  ORF Transcript_34388/g.95083 Transcript_34388/m.95083 type:complete len:269 (+) Transcript_34388:775-1581(+)